VSRLKLGVVGAGAWGRNHVRTAAGLADGQLAAECYLVIVSISRTDGRSVEVPNALAEALAPYRIDASA